MIYQSDAAEIDREDLRRELRHEDEPEPRVRVFRCRDRLCGGLDCATCYGENAARAFLLDQEEADL